MNTPLGHAALKTAVPLWRQAQSRFEAANGADKAAMLRDATKNARDAAQQFAKRLAQQAALAIGIGPVAGRSEGLHPLAVGFDQGDIDPVQRGAAHQAEGPQEG